ncbi:MAG: hypothetical protein JWQ66_2942 [Mucilaginibacter sp.]|nr:hypothetical protein [Mucilaginibacter sp.]
MKIKAMFIILFIVIGFGCKNYNKGNMYYKLADKYQDSTIAILHDGIHGHYSLAQIDNISKRADSLEQISVRYADSMNYYFNK